MIKENYEWKERKITEDERKKTPGNCPGKAGKAEIKAGKVQENK